MNSVYLPDHPLATEMSSRPISRYVCNMRSDLPVLLGEARLPWTGTRGRGHILCAGPGPGRTDSSLWAKSGLLPAFVNEALLEHNKPFMYRLWFLVLQRQGWGAATETMRPTKPKAFTNLALLGKVC